jgi:glutaredoxin
MVTPTTLRKSQEPAPIRMPLSRRGLLGLVVTVAVVWGLSQAWASWRNASLATAVKVMANASNVIMYTTSACPYCARAREWLAANGVSYHDCNVDLDQQCLAQYESKGQPGVPLMKVNGHWQLGFDPQWLALALESASAQPLKAQP